MLLLCLIAFLGSVCFLPPVLCSVFLLPCIVFRVIVSTLYLDKAQYACVCLVLCFSLLSIALCVFQRRGPIVSCVRCWAASGVPSIPSNARLSSPKASSHFLLFAHFILRYLPEVSLPFIQIKKTLWKERLNPIRLFGP